MNKVTKPRNFVHMTSQDWALYMTHFEPETREEAEEYLNDLLAYSKTGNLESGIAKVRVTRLLNDYPDLDGVKVSKIEFNDRFEQGGYFRHENSNAI